MIQPIITVIALLLIVIVSTDVKKKTKLKAFLTRPGKITMMVNRKGNFLT